MRTLLVERDELAHAESNEQTRLVLVGIGKADRPANGDVRDGDDPQDGRLSSTGAIPVLCGNPDLPNGEGGARQDHVLQEVPSLDVQILRPVNREVLAPRRLRLWRG